MARRWAASSAVPPGGGPEVTPQVRETIRDAVLAGPLAPAGLADDLCEGLFRQVTGGDLVERAVAGAGHVDVRRQVLTGPVTAQLVLGMCLFGDGYEAILDRLIPAVAAPLAPGADVPTPSALSLARARLGDEVMPAMFAASGVDLAAADLPGVRAFGMLVTATDGTCWDLAGSAAIAGEYATPAGGKHPQSRMVAVGACGTRHVLGAAIGSYTTREHELNDQLPGTLMPGTLNTADRNFFSMRRWCTAAATGAHLVWRVKNGAKTLPAQIIKPPPRRAAPGRPRPAAWVLAPRRPPHADTTPVRPPHTPA